MKRILVGLSGGVDSAVAAYILKQQGFEVVGGFMINYMVDDDSCPTKKDLAVAQEVAQYLGIKLHTFDFQEEYNNRIVQYIIGSYRNGLTPNPDVLCNSEVKFNLFLEEGLAGGFDAIATGHYARNFYQHGTLGAITYDHLAYPRGHKHQGYAPAEHRASHDLLSAPGSRTNVGKNTTTGEQEALSSDGYFSLHKGVDPHKDQSYFLAKLNQSQLAHAFFPLGGLTKPEVREIAKQAGLPNANRKDSQGICFIGKVPMRDFLRQYLPIQEGNILDTSGKIVGKHDGVWGYTIGQRKGIGVAASEPLFVLHKNVATNTITVGYAHEAELYTQDIAVSSRHWIGNPYSLPFSGHAKIRYRQDDQEMTLGRNIDKKMAEQHNKNILRSLHGGSSTIDLLPSLTAHFAQPQRAVASGQILVAYDGDKVIGSGIIE